MERTRNPENAGQAATYDDIQRVEMHDIPFVTPHICRICGGRITGSYIAETHFGGVTTFRCLSHAPGLGPTIREGKDEPGEKEGRFVRQASRHEPSGPGGPP